MDAAQFEQELPPLLPKLNRLATRLMGNPEDAKDAVQDALLRATTSIGGFRGEAKLETWLFGITVRIALDRLRAGRRWESARMAEACNERGAARVSAILGSPAVAFDVHEHIGLCFTCVGRSLGADEQTALVLREVYGYTNAESASMTGDSEPVFRHHLASARQKMVTEFDGLCTLVSKTGACHQCSTLRELAPAGRQGPALPETPLSFEHRLELVRSAIEGTEAYRPLQEHFLDELSRMNAKRSA
jgi:RNA polymerase sigma factor (sigma-70 family)